MLLNRPTLVIFCKRPKLHQGKQRLAVSIGVEDTLKIANALLDCAIEDAQQWQGRVVMACAHRSDMAWAKTLLSNAGIDHGEVIAQGEGNLGQRLNFIDKTLRNNNHQQLIFIGTDAPILHQSHYQETLAALKDNDIVLNHADDGGVVIMANNKAWPELTELPWSTEFLSESLAKLCQKSGFKLSYSKPGYDIDQQKDLQKLQFDLVNDGRAARQHLYKEINTLDFFTSEKKQCMT